MRKNAPFLPLARSSGILDNTTHIPGAALGTTMTQRVAALLKMDRLRSSILEQLSQLSC